MAQPVWACVCIVLRGSMLTQGLRAEAGEVTYVIVDLPPGLAVRPDAHVEIEVSGG